MKNTSFDPWFTVLDEDMSSTDQISLGVLPCLVYYGVEFFFFFL